MPDNHREQFLRSLIAHVDIMVKARGCDHSTQYAQTWAAFHEVDWQRLEAELGELGGSCDCKIVLNCRPDRDQF